MRTGYKKTEVGVIPEMWEVASLNMLTSRATGVWGSNVQDERHSHRVEIIRAGDISQDGRLTSTAIRYITPKELEKAKCSFDDLVITTSGNGLGKLWWCDGRENTAASNFVRVLHPFPSKVNGQFLAYALRTNEGIRQLKEHTATSAYPNLRPTYFSTKWVPLPHLAEQIAIATALSDVDGLLGGLDRLIAKKCDLKQAAMQELLSGKTRLPGFIDEWEVRRLGDLVQIEKGQLITRNTLLPGGIPVIAGGKKPAYHHAVANRIGRTITISASGANAGYVALYSDPIFASDCSTISEYDQYCLDFVYYQLLRVQQEIYKMQTGGAQPHIHAKDLNPMTFSFPDLTEQTAIAEVLIDLDAEVAGLEARREKTQALKQGMMQELLSGRIRLLQPEALHA